MTSQEYSEQVNNCDTENSLRKRYGSVIRNFESSKHTAEDDDENCGSTEKAVLAEKYNSRKKRDQGHYSASQFTLRENTTTASIDNPLTNKYCATEVSLKEKYGSSSRQHSATLSPITNTCTPPNNLSLENIFTALESNEYLYNSHEISDFLKKLEATKIENKKNIFEKINLLTAENIELKETNEQLKETNTRLQDLYQDANSKNGKVRLSIQTLYWEMENSKLFSTLSRPLLVPEEDNTINQIKTINDSVKNLSEDKHKQATLIKVKTKEYKKLNSKLTDSKKTNEDLKKWFEETLQSVKHSYQCQITDLQNAYTMQLEMNQKLLNEKSDLETKAILEKQELQQLLKENKDAVHKQKDAFAAETKKYENCLEEIFNNVEVYTKKLSIEDVMKRKLQKF